MTQCQGRADHRLVSEVVETRFGVGQEPFSGVETCLFCQVHELLDQVTSGRSMLRVTPPTRAYAASPPRSSARGVASLRPAYGVTCGAVQVRPRPWLSPAGRRRSRLLRRHSSAVRPLVRRWPRPRGLLCRRCVTSTSCERSAHQLTTKGDTPWHLTTLLKPSRSRSSHAAPSPPVSGGTRGRRARSTT